MPVTITNPVLAEHAAEIRRLGKQTVENVIEIGRHLAEAKAEVKKLGGAFDDWLKAEFNWSHGQAYNFINVFERKSELSKFDKSNLPVSALLPACRPEHTAGGPRRDNRTRRGGRIGPGRRGQARRRTP